MAINRQWQDTHVSLATDTHATIEELLEMAFSMSSVPRLCSESHEEKLDCQELRDWSWLCDYVSMEAEESPLLESITRQQLMKTQKTVCVLQYSDL
jgi:hypothetical protein